MTSRISATYFGEIAKDTLYLFFQPLLPRAPLLTRTRIPTIQTGGRYSDRALPVAFDLVTHNQANLIQYIYLASQKHKALRVALQGKGDKTKITGLRADLMKFLNAEFFAAISTNFGIMRDFFGERSHFSPRISVKGNFKTENRDAVITIFRDCDVPYELPMYVEDNTSLKECYRTGRYFISNDIVSDVARGRYKNSRISQDAVDDVLQRSWLPRRMALAREWLSIWNSGSRKEDAFKSALVIPISLSRNALSDEFAERIGMESVDRIIFGFLCVDHPEPGYFDEKIDVPFGYAVADVISIYAFTRLQFTDLSSTYLTAERAIDEGGIVDKISAAVKDAIFDVHRKAAREGVFKVEETENNRLVSDESLADLVKYIAEQGVQEPAS